MDCIGRKPICQACLFAAALGSAGKTVGTGLRRAPARPRGDEDRGWMSGQVVVAEEGPWLLAYPGYSVTLMMWCVAAPIVGAICSLTKKHVPPQRILEKIQR